MKRLIVLGAGSSVDFGFPSGIGLIKRIYRKWKEPDGELIDIFETLLGQHGKPKSSTPENKLKGFADQLFYSGAISIDDFLSQSTDSLLKDIGRISIFNEIIESEKVSIPCDAGYCETKEGETTEKRGVSGLFKWEQNWLREFFGKTLRPFKGVSDLKKHLQTNTLEFIIFNYDRCVEYYLYQAVKNYYSLANDEEVYEILKLINFTHIYGEI